VKRNLKFQEKTSRVPIQIDTHRDGLKKRRLKLQKKERYKSNFEDSDNLDDYINLGL